jgi:hypothetical protein
LANIKDASVPCGKSSVWILTQDNGESNFLINVIYTVDPGFTREGVFNVHNNREALGQIPATI